MKKQSDPDSYYFPLQLSQALCVPEKRILEWINSGELVAVNVGNSRRPRWRISPTEFDRFLESRSTAKGARP